MVPVVSRAFCAFVVWLIVSGCSAATQINDCDLRLNEIQRVASHNSYKKAMLPELAVALRKVDPELADRLDYSHVPLADQLDLGLGKLELDVFYDPSGDHYGPSSPGFRVMHVQNLDDQSHCPTLAACLGLLRGWSDTTPGHLPIAVSINAKDQVIDRPGFVTPLLFADAAWTDIDNVIEKALGDRLIRPGEVITSNGPVWPCLEAAKGKFLFVLDEGGDKRRRYAETWWSRTMFATLPPEHPGAAFMIINDPLNAFDQIREMVAAGYLVRTRADADTLEARRGDTRRRDAAFASGAQFVSTDYYQPAKGFGSDYVVRLPADKPFRVVRGR